MKFCHEILETHGENPKSLSHLVLERYRDVTDTETPRQNHHS